MKIKSNGHNVCTKLVKRESLIGEIEYFVEKYKLPINITVNELLPAEETQLSKKTSL